MQTGHTIRTSRTGSCPIEIVGNGIRLRMAKRGFMYRSSSSGLAGKNDKKHPA